jgi:hypothetical protein
VSAPFLRNEPNPSAANEAALDPPWSPLGSASDLAMKPCMDRPKKITIAELRGQGVRGLLVYCAEYHCSHHVAISGDRWPDDVLLSDLEPRFICKSKYWPASGSEDTELRCLMEQEAGHGEAMVYARVQGRGGQAGAGARSCGHASGARSECP